MLPSPGFVLLVIPETLNLSGDRTGPAGRPQAHIDRIKHAIIGLDGERADHALCQAGKILAAVERTLAVRLRMLLVEIVDHNQIEVGARGHFTGA